MNVPNNNQIDNTSYYMLPCGRQLEDFIMWLRLDFAWGSALKYVWRAGKKDGESRGKDLAKAEHYARLIERVENVDHFQVFIELEELMYRAKDWDGKEAA